MTGWVGAQKAIKMVNILGVSKLGTTNEEWPSSAIWPPVYLHAARIAPRSVPFFILLPRHILGRLTWVAIALYKLCSAVTLQNKDGIKEVQLWLSLAYLRRYEGTFSKAAQ